MGAFAEGYFDESGDPLDGDRVFALSGYFIGSSEAVEMSREWNIALSAHNLPYFHMVECAHGNGVFSKIEKEDRIELVKTLIQIIKKYTKEGVSSICIADDFKPSEQYTDPYVLGVDLVTLMLDRLISLQSSEPKIAFFFEDGHDSAGRAYSKVAGNLRKKGYSLTFLGKRESPVLQAADLLARQTTKYVKDQISNKRPPRKDFLSLMEHSHTFFYTKMSKVDEKQMGLEVWPLERRPRKSIIFNKDENAPIDFAYQEGYEFPICPVENIIGWKKVSSDMAFLEIQQTNEQKFSLLVDSMRMQQMAEALFNSKSPFEDNFLKVFAIPEHMAVVPDGDRYYLVFKVVNGAELAIPLSNDTATFLIQELSKIKTSPK